MAGSTDLALRKSVLDSGSSQLEVRATGVRRIKQIALCLFVHLMAASTLVAGMPLFLCICPNGAVKPFCFASTSEQRCCCRSDSCSVSKTSCCCEGHCCSAKSARNSKDSSEGSPVPKPESVPRCCSCSANHLNDPPENVSASPKPCCTKLVVSAPSWTSPKKPVENVGSLLHPSALEAPVVSNCVIETTFRWRIDLMPHPPPIPLDRIITFQRFLI